MRRSVALCVMCVCLFMYRKFYDLITSFRRVYPSLNFSQLVFVSLVISFAHHTLVASLVNHFHTMTLESVVVSRVLKNDGFYF